MSINNNLKAYVKYDKQGYLVPGSLSINNSKPAVGDWEEIPYSECCPPVVRPTYYTLRLIFDNPANAPVANPNDVNDWNTLFNTTKFVSVIITPDGEIQLKGRSGISTGTYASVPFDGDIHLLKVIDEGCISQISFNAFSNCTNLEYVDFPSVTQIDNACFFGCTSLSYVNLPLVSIVQSDSFTNCTSLTTLNLNEDIAITIYDRAFKGAYIPDDFPFEKVGYIGFNGFENATNVGDITFDKLGQFGQYAFAGSDVTSVTISSINPNMSWFQGYVFYNCTSLTSFTVNGESNVVSVSNYMFYGCVNLSTISVASYIGQISDYGFYNCSSLDGLFFPRCIYIFGTNVFAGCTGVNYIYLPFATQLGATSGDDNIFLGITGKTISYAVFNNTVLTNNSSGPDGDILYLVANNTVTYTNSLRSTLIGFDTLSTISSLVPTYNNVASWNTLFDLPANGAVFTSVITAVPGASYPQNYPIVNLAGAIGDRTLKPSLFENVSGLLYYDEVVNNTNVDESRVKIIGNSAFKNSGIRDIYLVYATTIGNNAFQGCGYLGFLYWGGKSSGYSPFPAVTSIGDYAFEGAGSISPRFHPSNTSLSPSFLSTIGQYCFANSKIFKGFSLGLLSIPQYAFQNSTLTTGFSFSNVTSIGDGAFAGCTAMTSLSIPYCDYLGSTTGDNGVFAGITGKNISLNIQQDLYTVNAGLPDGDLVYLNANNTVTNTYTATYPSGLRITFDSAASALAFFGGTIDVASVNAKFATVGNATPYGRVSINRIGKMVTCYGGAGVTIPNGTFSGNTNLITILDGPDEGPYLEGTSFSIVGIGDDAFNGCTSLTSARLQVATAYGARAFKDCTVLNDINLQNAYTIGDNCFENCTSLTSFNYIRDLVSVGNYAFAGCTGVTSYDFPALATIGNYAFYNNTSVTTINIPYCAALGTTTGNNNVFTGISGNTISLTIPSALDTDADVVALQAANTVTIDRPSLQLTFTDKAVVDTLVGGSTTVANWNTFFSLPTNGTPFTSVTVTENVPLIRSGYPGPQIYGCEVKLYGGGNMTIPANRFSSYRNLRKVVDNGNTVVRVNDSAFRQPTLNWYNNGGNVGYTPIEISLPACTLMEQYAFLYSFGAYFVNLPRMQFFTGTQVLWGVTNYSTFYGPNLQQQYGYSGPAIATSLSLPNTISLASFSILAANSFSSINLPQQTFIPQQTFYAGYGHLNIPAATSTGNFIWTGTGFGFNTWFVNMPLVTVFGTTVGNNSQWGSSTSYPYRGSYRINPFLLTNNAGGPDGDVVQMQTSPNPPFIYTT